MPMRRILGVLPATSALWAHAAAAPAIVPDSDIRRILAERIDRYHQSVGIVVGVIDSQGSRVVSYGRANTTDNRPVDGDTIFDLASITKLFTSLALAEMVQRGEVALDDPVAMYLPSEVTVPERNGRRITLEDLATHTSGLPREATNFRPVGPELYASGYSLDDLYGFLSTYRLQHDPGSHFEYSNLGVSLLGIALARSAGVDYETLIKTRVSDPLGMTSTTTAPTPDMAARSADGHGYASRTTGHLNPGIFAAAGSLRSTAHDLLTLLAVVLGYQDTALRPAIRLTQTVTRPMAPAIVRLLARGYQIHLGWLSTRVKGETIWWHNGATTGFRSFIGFDPVTRRGVVVLSNSGFGEGVEDIGMHLLNPKAPLLSAKTLTPPAEHQEITIDAKVLDGYLGRYRFADDDIVTATREGSQLVMVDGDLTKDPNADKDPYYPSSAVTFFSRNSDAQLTFTVDRQGRASQLVFTFAGGRTKRYSRIP
jgi:D-alanyl-D-alanine-carboxypeptidase/D-alanyl-D-alanine-endopeptidase